MRAGESDLYPPSARKMEREEPLLLVGRKSSSPVPAAIKANHFHGDVVL